MKYVGARRNGGPIQGICGPETGGPVASRPPFEGGSSGLMGPTSQREAVTIIIGHVSVFGGALRFA